MTHASALAALLLILVGCQADSFTGTWIAVGAQQEIEEDVFSAKLILDDDGYVLALVSQADFDKDADGNRIATEGQAHAVEGSWDQMTDRRIELSLDLQEDKDEDVIPIRLIGWRTGPDTMEVTLKSPERGLEAFVIQVERQAEPDAAE